MNVKYTCANCGREIEEGQFIAIIGEAPSSGLSTPIGRADKIIDDIGSIYCGECFQLIGTEELAERARYPEASTRR